MKLPDYVPGNLKALVVMKRYPDAMLYLKKLPTGVNRYDRQVLQHWCCAARLFPDKDSLCTRPKGHTGKHVHFCVRCYAVQSWTS